MKNKPEKKTSPEETSWKKVEVGADLRDLRVAPNRWRQIELDPQSDHDNTHPYYVESGMVHLEVDRRTIHIWVMEIKLHQYGTVFHHPAWHPV